MNRELKNLMTRMMSKKLLLILLLTTATLNAQRNGTKFTWRQPAPTLTVAQNYTYKYYLDLSATGIKFTKVTCTGIISPFQCITNIPLLSMGRHSVTVTALNAGTESDKSDFLTFQIVALY